MEKVHKYIRSYIDHNCFIAGGALMDIERGEVPNDIDVFFYCGEHKPYWNTKNLIELVLDFAGFDYSIEESPSDKFLYTTANQIERVFNLYIDGYKFQFIQLGKYGMPKERVLNFPLSTSQIYLHLPWEGVKTTPAYDYSQRHKVIINTLEEYPQDCPYISKIRNKLKDFTYISNTVDFVNYLDGEAKNE